MDVTQPTGTEARVCADIAQRQALGMAKYGTTVQLNPLPLRAWLQHAYEECLDQAVYLRRAMDELDAIDAQVTAQIWRKDRNRSEVKAKSPKEPYFERLLKRLCYVKA